MIYTLNYPSHPIERVNQAVFEFLRNSIPDGVYTRNLFPQWFRNVLANSKAKQGFRSFEEKFIDVFKEFQTLPPQTRQEIFDKYEGGIDIKSLCESTTKEVVLTETYSATLHSALKMLLKDHFYGISLNNNKIIQNELSTSLKDHYVKFKELNRSGRVCPFCGLHEYALIEGEAKDDYDHWLYKEKYPLYAVNFSNLVPMCDKCNQTGVKGTADVLYDEDTGNRRLSFYPYDENSGVSINVINYTPQNLLLEDKKEKFPYGYFNLSVTHNSIDEAEKVQTWKKVFKIETRFNSYLSEYYNQIKDDFHEVYLPSHMEHNLDTNAENLRAIVQAFINQIGNPKRKTCVNIDRAYLNFICRPENAHLLYTFCNINLAS